MATKKEQPDMTVLKGWRVCFENLDTEEEFEGKKGKFAITVMALKTSDDIKKVDTQVKRIYKELGLKKKLPADRLPIKDGDETKYDNQDGHYVLRATSKRRPVLIDEGGMQRANAEEAGIYAGCFVNLSVDFWGTDSHGARVVCELLGVRKSEDGEPFGAGRPVSDIAGSLGGTAYMMDDTAEEEEEEDPDAPPF